MAKIVQLKRERIDIYPKTLGNAVVVSGNTLLSDKLNYIDTTFNEIKEGSILVGSSASAMTDNMGNIISSTYIKETEISSISEDKIVALFD